MSGQLTDGQRFAFKLDRSGDTVTDLERRMEASFEDFKASLAPAPDGPDLEATTTFRYSIDERALEAVRQGVRSLEIAGPYVTALNQEFKRIQFLAKESGIVLQLRERRVLAEHIEEVGVDVSADDCETPERCSFVVAGLDGVAVAVPFARRGEEAVLVSPTSAPKLLLGFPLIGTEDFSFPAVVHSLRFSPTEDRDGVYLGQNDDQVNRENQSVLEEACRLLLCIAGFAAKWGWAHIHTLAHVPTVREQRWLDETWLRSCLRTSLVDPIRATPSVLTESGSAVAPKSSTLPTADSPEAVDQLWSLARALTDLKDTLPRQAEADGWCGAARKWAALYDRHLSELEETMDGRDLAARAEDGGIDGRVASSARRG